MPRRGLPALGGVGLIVLCFLGSAGLRLSGNGTALAEGLGALGGAAAAPDGAEAMLTAIRAREAELEAEALALAERRQTLNIAEAKLAEQLEAFEVAQRGLAKTLALADEAAERDVARMTTVYENMKPAEAAAIFERMDVAFAAGLIARMRPDLAAEVLAGMSAEAAYAVTLTITSRHAGVPTE